MSNAAILFKLIAFYTTPSQIKDYKERKTLRSFESSIKCLDYLLALSSYKRWMCQISYSPHNYRKKEHIAPRINIVISKHYSEILKAVTQFTSSETKILHVPNQVFQNIVFTIYRVTIIGFANKPLVGFVWTVAL